MEFPGADFVQKRMFFTNSAKCGGSLRFRRLTTNTSRSKRSGNGSRASLFFRPSKWRMTMCSQRYQVVEISKKRRVRARGLHDFLGNHRLCRPGVPPGEFFNSLPRIHDPFCAKYLENAWTMPVGSGPWGIRRENGRLIRNWGHWIWTSFPEASSASTQRRET